MRKKLFIILAGVFLFSCNQGTNTSETEDHDSHAETTDTVLTLNEGAKWQADSITNHNLVRLKTTADMFRVEPFPSLETYQMLGNDLSGDVNTMLEQCKMKGADHEALHKWLTPIISQSNQLKNVTDTAEGRKIFAAVDQRIDAYHQYFE